MGRNTRVLHVAVRAVGDFIISRLARQVDGMHRIEQTFAKQATTLNAEVGDTILAPGHGRIVPRDLPGPTPDTRHYSRYETQLEHSTNVTQFHRPYTVYRATGLALMRPNRGTTLL